MRKAVIAFFSGTGNTRRAVGVVAKEFEERGWEVETLDIAAGRRIPVPGPGGLLLFAFPALGFSAPATVLASARRMERAAGDGAGVGTGARTGAGLGVRAAALCCVGSTFVAGRLFRGWSGVATLEVLAALRSRGYLPAGSADVSYPENWTQASNPPNEEHAATMITMGDAEALAFGAAIAATAIAATAIAATPLTAGEGTFLRRGILTRALAGSLAFVFRHFARRFLGRMFAADPTCTGCALCARTCPAGAIAMRRGMPAWKANCVACNRCINACPSRSIQTSVARLVLIGGLNIAALFAAPPLAGMLLRALLPGAAAASSLPALLLSLALFGGFTALQIGPLDALVRGLEGLPGARRVFGASFTKGFRRYLAPGFKPGGEPYRD